MLTKLFMRKHPKNFLENNTKLFLALMILGILVYAKSLKFGFTSMDEQWMIVKDTAFLEQWSSVKTAFTAPSTDMYYRPLFMISLIVDYHLGKLSPFIYHFSNLLWHLISVILLNRFLLLVSIEKKAAFIFSLLFSVHPALLHAVAWIPGRNDIMLAVFMLLSLIYLKKMIDTSLKKYFLLNLIFFICALFTKENAIILPLIFSAFCLTFDGFKPRRLFLFLILWVSLSVSWLLIRHSIINANNIIINDFPVLIKNFLLGFLIFIGKILLPIKQSVLPDIKNSSVALGIFTLTPLIVFCFIPGLRNKKIAFLGMFIFIGLLIIPVWFGASKTNGEHYEQRMYGAMIGIALFFTQIKFDLHSKKFLYCIGSVLLFYILKTSDRMSIYKNERSFIEAGIKECPDYYLFYLQKADLLSNQKKYNEAIIYYTKAIDIRPDFATALSNRGLAYYNAGKLTESIEDYTRAINNAPFTKQFYLNRCLAYSKNQNAESAMKDFIVIKKCCSEMITAEIDKSITDNWILVLEGVQKQIKIAPNDPKLYYKCAQLYFDIEMKPQGNACLRKALELDPENKEYESFQLKVNGENKK